MCKHEVHVRDEAASKTAAGGPDTAVPGRGPRAPPIPRWGGVPFKELHIHLIVETAFVNDELEQIYKERTQGTFK